MRISPWLYLFLYIAYSLIGILAQPAVLFELNLSLGDTGLSKLQLYYRSLVEFAFFLLDSGFFLIVIWKWLPYLPDDLKNKALDKIKKHLFQDVWR